MVQKERKNETAVPKPSDYTQRVRALSFIENLVRKLNGKPDEAANLIIEAGSFRITISKPVFQKLKESFSTEHETGFLLFVDPKTNIITEAVAEPSEKQGKHSFGFSWGFVKKTVAEMRERGLEFAGNYHSHTGPTELGKEIPDYDHSLPSPDDVTLFPGIIPGTNSVDRNDPEYQQIARMNRVLLLGAVREVDFWPDKFQIRAFASLDDYGLLGNNLQFDDKGNFEERYPYQNAGREITAAIKDNFIFIINQDSVKHSLVKHYRSDMRVVEFQFDIN